MTIKTLNVLEQALLYRQQLKLPFIGIAGSSGKTITMALILAILRQQGKVHAFPFECTSADDIADEMVQVAPDCNWAVVQIQAASPTSVAQELEIVQPQIGLITNVNLDNFARNDVVEAAAFAKSLVVQALPGNGFAILNRDNDFTRGMEKVVASKVIFFGLSEAADYYAANIEYLGPDGTAFTIRRKNCQSLRLRMPIYNLVDVSCSVAAAAVARALDIDDEIVLEALEKHFAIPEGWGRLHRLDGLMVIDDTQHCSTHSMLRATKTLLNFKPHATRLVFGMGAMRPMGDLTMEYHRRTGYYLAGMPIDMVFTVGKTASILATAMASMLNGKNRKIITYDNIDAAVAGLSQELREGDILMVNGSEEDDMARIVQAIVGSS